MIPRLLIGLVFPGINLLFLLNGRQDLAAAGLLGVMSGTTLAVLVSSVRDE